MSFWRRWLKQWGYVRIRDYGLIVTDAGQVIRISDGVVVNASAPPALPAAPVAVAYPIAAPPPSPTPPAPTPPAPAPAPPQPKASVAPPPAPVVVAPPKPRLQLPRASRQVAAPPLPVPKLPPRKAAGTAPPPPPRLRPSARPVGSSPDVTAVSERPVFEAPPVAKRPLPRLTGRPRIPPRPKTETETTTITGSDFDLPMGEPTLVDEPATTAPRPEPASSAPLPRLSARLAARRKT